MFLGADASVQGGPTPVQEWPEHTIELGRVLLTPSAGPSIGTARHRQMAVYLLVC